MEALSHRGFCRLFGLNYRHAMACAAVSVSLSNPRSVRPGKLVSKNRG